MATLGVDFDAVVVRGRLDGVVVHVLEVRVGLGAVQSEVRSVRLLCWAGDGGAVVTAWPSG